MEPIRNILHQNLIALGLAESSEVRYYRTSLGRFVFSYPDSTGSARVRKIILNSYRDSDQCEGLKAQAWFDHIGLQDYFVFKNDRYQIIDTPFLGHELSTLRRNYPIAELNSTSDYLFRGFTIDYVDDGLGILKGMLMEFYEQTGLIHTDLSFRQTPNNIVWNPYIEQGVHFNVIDYESFKPGTEKAMAVFHTKWGEAVDYIMQNLLVG